METTPHVKNPSVIDCYDGITPTSVPEQWNYQILYYDPTQPSSPPGSYLSTKDSPDCSVVLVDNSTATDEWRGKFSFRMSRQPPYAFLRGHSVQASQEGIVTEQSGSSGRALACYSEDYLLSLPLNASFVVGVYPREDGASLPDGKVEIVFQSLAQGRYFVTKSVALAPFVALTRRVWQLRRRDWLGDASKTCIVDDLHSPVSGYAMAKMNGTIGYYFLTPTGIMPFANGRLGPDHSTWRDEVAMAGNANGLFSLTKTGDVYLYSKSLSEREPCNISPDHKFSDVTCTITDSFVYAIKTDRTVWRYDPTQQPGTWEPVCQTSDFKAAVLVASDAAVFAIAHPTCPPRYGPSGAVFSLLEGPSPVLFGSDQLHINQLKIASNFLVGLASGDNKMYVWNGDPGSWTDLSTAPLRPWGGVRDVVDGGSLGIVALSGDQREIVQLDRHERRWNSLGVLTDEWRLDEGTLTLCALVDDGPIFGIWNGRAIFIYLPGIVQ
ncbi:hypothetical protein LV164_001302 [Aspergillus fumigatus]|nr:hypothetical protein KXX42_006411 [Aspergillus fumigatus]KAH1553126.1 hypothetical protein KXX57_007069 [Aspergillus fumigatus]KAH1987169.1 hypothetical protein KXW88_004362 [Aspergillus fumigatus]KAH2167074.1 hypothetical protein KXV74_003665 [Aspergillus fumigatus]KAH2312605.1 hypothetical protein KXV47_003796 [Aspergillus fumigatus]